MPRFASLTLIRWLSALVVTLLTVSLTHASPLASVTATRPKPIVLTTAEPPTKPRTSKPDSGGAPDLGTGGGGSDTTASSPNGGGSTATNTNGGGSTATNTNGWLYYPCTSLDVSLVMSRADADAQQCMAFSTYDFGSGFLPTTEQQSLLCDTGCWPLINRLLVTPIPYCSVVLGGRAVNYIDALYTIFADCVAGPSQTSNEQAVVPEATTSSSETPAPSSDATSWGMKTLSLAVVSTIVMVL